MGIFVTIQNNARIKYVLAVEEALYPLHKAVCLLAPLQLYKWRHIAAGAMLCLKRAVIFANHHIGNILHKVGILNNLLFAAKVLIEHKVQVAGKCMAKNYGILIAIFVKYLPQLCCCLGQLWHREADVLNNGGGAGLSHTRNGRECLLAQFPECSLLLGILCKLIRKLCLKALYPLCNCSNLLLQLLLILCAALNKQRASPVGDALNILRNALSILHRFHSRPVQQFNRRDRQFLQLLYGTAGLLYCRINCKRKPFVLMLHNSIVGNAGNKGQSSLRTNYNVFKNIKGLPIVHKGIQAISCGILYLILPLYALLKLRIGINLPAYSLKPLQKLAVGCPEGLPGLLAGSIQHSSVRKDKFKVCYGLV